MSKHIYDIEAMNRKTIHHDRYGTEEFQQQERQSSNHNRFLSSPSYTFKDTRSRALRGT